jgi:hypothetical protein
MAKDQLFTQTFPDAAMQVRKTILTLFPWLNFRQFEPRNGAGGNPQQPMGINEFAGQFPAMRNSLQGQSLPDLQQGAALKR